MRPNENEKEIQCSDYNAISACSCQLQLRAIKKNGEGTRKYRNNDTPILSGRRHFRDAYDIVERSKASDTLTHALFYAAAAATSAVPQLLRALFSSACLFATPPNYSSTFSFSMAHAALFPRSNSPSAWHGLLWPPQSWLLPLVKRIWW